MAAKKSAATKKTPVQTEEIVKVEETVKVEKKPAVKKAEPVEKEVAEKICDRIAVIDKGKIIFVGTCEELKEQAKSSESLEESFLKIIEGTEENEQ